MSQYNGDWRKLNSLNILFGILLAFLITSQEFQFFNLVFGAILKQVIVGIFTVFFFIAGIYKSATKRGSPNRFWAFYIVVLTFFFYLVIHDFMFNDGLKSIKYALYLVLTIFNWDSIKLIKAARIFVYFISFFCLLVLLQFAFLTIFYAGHISSFSLVDGLEKTLGREDLSLVNPFGFGFLTSNEWDTPFTFGIFEMRRANSYTTEPKFIALIFLTSLGILCVLKDTFVKRFSLLLSINFLGLCLTMAGSMFFGLVMVLLLYRFNRNRFRFSKTIFFFFSILFLFSAILLFALVYLPEYWTARALNGISSLVLLNDMFSNSYSLMGEGYGDEEGGFLFLPYVILIRYGWIGLSGMILVFIFLIYSFASLKLISVVKPIDYQLLGVIILLVNYFLYFIVFLPEIVSPLSTFIIIIILNVRRMSMARNLTLQKS